MLRKAPQFGPRRKEKKERKKLEAIVQKIVAPLKSSRKEVGIEGKRYKEEEISYCEAPGLPAQGPWASEPKAPPTKLTGPTWPNACHPLGPMLHPSRILPASGALTQHWHRGYCLCGRHIRQWHQEYCLTSVTHWAWTG